MSRLTKYSNDKAEVVALPENKIELKYSTKFMCGFYQGKVIDKLAQYEDLGTVEEIKAKLKNAIVPKFKVGQEVWFLSNELDFSNYELLNGKIGAFEFNNYETPILSYFISQDGTRDTLHFGYNEEKYVFATKQEAEERLKELEG